MFTDISCFVHDAVDSASPATWNPTTNASVSRSRLLCSRSPVRLADLGLTHRSFADCPGVNAPYLVLVIVLSWGYVLFLFRSSQARTGGTKSETALLPLLLVTRG
jgi:hypothetical protein